MRITRVQVEEREDRLLAPYAMRAAHSAGRRFAQEQHPLRTAFQRDRDRIVHCTAFRRLQYKTQVFVNQEGDHFRTRLTHTTEVAQVARTIARVLACNEDLTEAIALAHDLGHPPFGHSGEDVLRELMSEHGGFEHNRQGLRVLDSLEQPYPDHLGLNLTYEVRRAILKYPRAEHPAEAELLARGRPSIEGQLVDHADSIAYVHHDLDDGLRAGILDERELAREVELWSEVSEALTESLGDLPDPRRRQKRIVRNLIDRTVSDLIGQTLENLDGVADVEEVGRAPGSLVAHSPELARKKAALKRYLNERFYSHPQVRRLTSRSGVFLRSLWEHYVRLPETLPLKWQEWAEREGRERAVCDYIAGMTDRMANDDYASLFLPYH